MVLSDGQLDRVLVAGTGSIGRRHIANLQVLRPNARFALLRGGARTDDYSRALGAVVFASLDEALAWGPQLAVVATPSNLHYEILPDLLDAGVATFVEKPVVIRGADADALAGRDGGMLPPTQVGCVLRFLPVVGTLAAWLAAGRLGKLVRARLECGQYLPDWRPAADYRESYSADAGRGGGVLFDLVHEIDLAVLLFGDCRLEHVQAARRSGLELACDDVAHLALSGPDGLPVAIGLDYVSRSPVRNLEIVGDAASARLDFIARTLTLCGPDGDREQATEGFDVAAAYVAAMAELVEAAEQGSATRLPLAEGLRATRIALAAHERAHANPELAA